MLTLIFTSHLTSQWLENFTKHSWKSLKVCSDLYPSPDNDFYNRILPDIFGYNFRKYQLQLFLFCLYFVQQSRKTQLHWKLHWKLHFFSSKSSFQVCYLSLHSEQGKLSKVEQNWAKLRLEKHKQSCLNGVYFCKSDNSIEPKSIFQEMDIIQIRLPGMFHKIT